MTGDGRAGQETEIGGSELVVSGDYRAARELPQQL